MNKGVGYISEWGRTGRGGVVESGRRGILSIKKIMKKTAKVLTFNLNHMRGQDIHVPP